MRIYFLFIFYLLFSSSIFAQEVQVLEKETQLPISGVVIFNPENSKIVITDFDGFANLSIFRKTEKITFQHISHNDKTSLKSEIISSGNKIFLQQDPNALDEIVLSVAKFKQQKRDVSQQILSINSDDIQFKNPQTAADLLQQTGAVYVQKSQLGGGSPLIRGFSTNRLLIAVDGVRFNTAIFRGGNVQNIISIDPFAIERTEVILGAGSVIYGSDAIGGVINFYTKKPKFSFEEGFAYSGNATTRYATANNEKTGHIDFNIGGKEWAFLSSVSYSDFDDLRMGSHGPDDYLRNEYVVTENGVDTVVENENPKFQNPTGYDQLNLMQRIRYMPSEKWDFNLGLFYTTTSDYPRYDRLIRKRNGKLRAAEWYYGPQDWFNANLQITNKGTSLYDEAITSLSFQQFKESRNDRDFGKPTLFETDEKVNAYTAACDLTKKLNDITLFYGIEAIYNKVNSNGSQTNIETRETAPNASRYPDGSTWQSYAGYGSLLWKLNEELTFTSGLRYNHFLIDAKFDDTFYDFPFSEININSGSLTGSAGLTWNPNKIFGSRINFGTAFRAPNIDDIGKIFDSEPGSVVVPNPDLESEYAYNGELGVTFNFGNIVKLDFATYMTKLENALVRRDFAFNGETEIEYQGELSNVQAIQNAAKAEVYGFEANVEINFTKNLQLTSTFNITNGFEEDDDGSQNPIRHAAPQFGNTHLIFNKNKLKVDFFGVYNGQFDFEDLAPSQAANYYLYAKDANGDPYSPNWYTLNIAAQYQFTKALSLNATLENITDQRYRPYSSGISAAGRNLILAVSYRF